MVSGELLRGVNAEMGIGELWRCKDA